MSRPYPTAAATLLGCFAILVPAGSTVTAQPCEVVEIPAGPLRYEVLASAPRLNRRVTGPVEQTLHGVPAEPVDSFVYDGNGSVEIDGRLELVIDPVAEVGIIEATWTDFHGDWRYSQQTFLHPEHWSGVRIGSSVNKLSYLINEGVTSNVYLHGDTEAGMGVLPTVFNFLATWGPAKVELNGRPFENPFEFPAPDWIGHAMVTEGVRYPDGSVRTASGEIYDPSQAGAGAVEHGDLEVHLAFHDEHFPMTGNFPPIFSFFYHLVFEDVSIVIRENDAPIIVDPTCLPSLGTSETPRPLQPAGGRN
jgi:hypothetical protein